MSKSRLQSTNSPLVAPFNSEFLKTLTRKRLELSGNTAKLTGIRQSFPELRQISSERLKTCLLEALDNYCLWHCKYGAFCDGLGKKTSFTRLAKSLATATSILEAPGVLNRLYVVRQQLEGPLANVVPTDLDYKWNPLKHPALVVNKLKELIELVEEALKLDVRAIDTSRDGDLKSAAVPLRELWVVDAEQSGALWKSDNHYSRAVEFITCGLKVIDIRASRRLVSEFELD